MDLNTYVIHNNFKTTLKETESNNKPAKNQSKKDVAIYRRALLWIRASGIYLKSLISFSQMKFIPPNPIKVDYQNDGGSSYGSEYGGRGRGGGGGGWSTRSFSPPEAMPPRRKVVDEDIDNLFDRTAAKINYKFDPENTKVR